MKTLNDVAKRITSLKKRARKLRDGLDKVGLYTERNLINNAICCGSGTLAEKAFDAGMLFAVCLEYERRLHSRLADIAALGVGEKKL